MARQLRSTAYTCMYVSVYVSAVMRRLLVARKALSTHTHTKRWRPMWTTSECAFALFYLQMYIYVLASLALAGVLIEASLLLTTWSDRSRQQLLVHWTSRQRRLSNAFIQSLVHSHWHLHCHWHAPQ